MNRIKPLRSERHYALDKEFAPDTRVWPACSGPCDSGRKLCPSPMECQLPEGGVPLLRWPFVVGIVAAAFFVVWTVTVFA